jgi:ribosome-binding factor A
MNFRISRVNALLQEALANILQKYYREESTMITITRVTSSSDLQHISIYIGLMGDETQQKQALRWLHKKKFDLRQHLNREVVLKFSPELHFIIDDAYLQEMKIVSLLSEIENEIAPEPIDSENSATS